VLIVALCIADVQLARAAPGILLQTSLPEIQEGELNGLDPGLLAPARLPNWLGLALQLEEQPACRLVNGSDCTIPGMASCSQGTFFQELVHVGVCISCNKGMLTPGFTCQEGRLKRCPAGHYCPFADSPSPSSLALVSSNVGQRKGTQQIIQCPEGTICYEGFTEPLKCSNFWVSCPAGARELTSAFRGRAVLSVLLFGSLLAFVLWRLRPGFLAAGKLDGRGKFAGSQDSCDDFKCGYKPVDIVFEDVGLELKSSGKRVLQGITGRFPPASLVALMGPSGAGKTTFMNALLGCAHYGVTTGKVKVNSNLGSLAAMPSAVGFVPQDDIMHSNLTVFDNLYYQAVMRLPSEMSHAKKLEQVWQTIEVLGLSRVQHCLVGNEHSRGISGGEKKCVNIGMELVAMPAVIFMDEPTSGLDGSVAWQLAKTLRRLQQRGLSIICIIHQPRWAVFKEFSHLLLLGSGGHQVYCGQAAHVEDYLTGLGYRMPQHENVADWIIDVVSGVYPRETDAAIGQLGASATSSDPGYLFKAWRDTLARGSLKCNGDDPPLVQGEGLCSRPALGICAQGMVLFRRCLRQHSHEDFGKTTMCLLGAGLFAGRMLASQSTFEYGSIVKFLTLPSQLYHSMVAVNAISLLGSETLQYTREFDSGFSCVAFWAAKNLYLMLHIVVSPLFYTLPIYLMAPRLQTYLSLWKVYVMSGFVWSGFGVFVSVLLRDPAICILFLISWPMFEPFFDGAMFNVGLFSQFTCGRWFRAYVFSAEVRQLPESAQTFPEITSFLKKDKLSADFAGVELRALVMMLLLGMMWRLLALSLFYERKWKSFSRIDTRCRQVVRILIDSMRKMSSPKW